MQWIARRTENGEHIVVLKYAAAFYWLMWPTLILTILAAVLSTRWWGIAAGIAWLMLIATAIPNWMIVRELKRQMRNGSLTASGSKYSFSNPLTYRWSAPH